VEEAGHGGVKAAARMNGGAVVLSFLDSVEKVNTVVVSGGSEFTVAFHEELVEYGKVVSRLKAPRCTTRCLTGGSSSCPEQQEEELYLVTIKVETCDDPVGISSGKRKCFLCLREGHQAGFCPQKRTAEQNQTLCETRKEGAAEREEDEGLLSVKCGTL